MSSTMSSLVRFGLALVAAALAFVSAPSCRSEFPVQHSSAVLTMTRTAGEPGSPTKLLPLNFATPDTYTFDLKALTPEGDLDTTFNGYVRISAHPGSVAAVTGPGATGRNVQLINGAATGIQVQLLAAYGNTHLWAEDIGYTPADPLPDGGAKNAQCADGIDNNDNGLIDFPADPGCAYANDDTEDQGTYATGISEILYYASPRVADVRGVSQGGSSTSFPNEQVDMDVGYRTAVPCQDGTAPPCYDFSVIVTRISSTGFYVTDINDTRGFNSVYAYNFSAPPNMSYCDRLTSFGGTSADFYGFTEVNYPTWSLDEWRGPTERPCGIPEPVVLTDDDLPADTVATMKLLSLEAGLVRVESGPILDANGNPTGDTMAIHVGAHFGESNPMGPDFVPTATASDCDLDGDGSVDFTAGSDEDKCSNACDADIECTEYSNYVAESQFRVALVRTNADGSMSTGAVLANASAAAQSHQLDATTGKDSLVTFDPLVEAGKSLAHFTGTLDYFSGGTQFTIQARCPDDIIISGNALASDTACVTVRTASEFTE